MPHDAAAMPPLTVHTFLYLSLAVGALLVRSTQSSPKISYNSESSSSSSLRHIQVQDFLYEAPTKCLQNVDNIATYVNQIEDLIIDNSYYRVRKLKASLNSYESTEQRNATLQVDDLKRKVKHEAAQALCPVPEDPDLIGELNVIIDLIYEMCNHNYIEEAQNIRDSASDRMEKLIMRIQSVSDFINGTENPSEACFELVEDAIAELDEIQELEAVYKDKAQSVYSMCFQMAYAHAENYLPSMVKIATSCQAKKITMSDYPSIDIQTTE